MSLNFDFMVLFLQVGYDSTDDGEPCDPDIAILVAASEAASKAIGIILCLDLFTGILYRIYGNFISPIQVTIAEFMRVDYHNHN